MQENVTNPENKMFFSINEMAAITSISVGMLRKEIKAGKLKTRRAGRKILISKSDLMDYLDNESAKES